MAQASVSHHVYPNGLVLVAETMPAVRSAAFSFLVPAGAAYDPEDAGGTASMLSEWIMRGAGDRDSRDLLTALDTLGVSHGEGAQTVHSSVSAATLGTNIIPALEIYADVLLRPRLEDDEVEPIRALALQNLQGLEDDPGSKVIYELRKRHFPDPWGRPSPGTLEGVANATPDGMRAFHARHYRPNGAILAVAGAIDFPALKDAVARLFGDWEPGPEPAVQVRPGGPRRDHIAKETQQTQIALAFPTVTVTHPDHYQARAAIAILGGYASARLFTEVREKRGLCYSVYSSYESQRDRAAVICYAGTSSERAQETLDVTLAEIHRLGQDGIDAEELDMMRAGLKSSLVMAQESSMSRSGSLASDWYYLGRVRPLDEIAGALDALTPESVSAFAAGQKADDLTILTLGPAPLDLPPEAGPAA
ncbi:M16 family metallopeptidase [Tundrisphaera sp. TA3]|uniref:M16 family metallopeptidase n=1 Tax=Tundrisphaera sp. TA3 TaxID=3435775 RepID=UPI003EBBC8B6